LKDGAAALDLRGCGLEPKLERISFGEWAVPGIARTSWSRPGSGRRR
jgi:hypothetical protein